MKTMKTQAAVAVAVPFGLGGLIAVYNSTLRVDLEGNMVKIHPSLADSITIDGSAIQCTTSSLVTAMIQVDPEFQDVKVRPIDTHSLVAMGAQVKSTFKPAEIVEKFDLFLKAIPAGSEAEQMFKTLLEMDFDPFKQALAMGLLEITPLLESLQNEEFITRVTDQLKVALASVNLPNSADESS